MAGRLLAGDAEDGALALGDLAERLGASAQTVSRPTRWLWTSPAARRRLRWWLTSGWREPDVRDELADRGVALGQALDDAQPVDVGEGLVERPQVAQVIGLDDDRWRWSCGCGRGRHGWEGTPGGRWDVASTAVDINGR